MEAVLVSLTLLAMLVALVREWAAPVVVFLLGLGVMLAGGVIGTEEGFAGFSSEALVIIGSLFVIAHAVERNTGLEKTIHKILGNARNSRAALLRMTGPVALLSGFINNTPVVSMLVPQVSKWARKHGISASAFLMPLSFAAVLGGTLTLVGTSTNIAVSGLLRQYGYEPFGFFEVSIVGLPIAIAGTVLLVLLTPKLLPGRKSVFDSSEAASREFTFEAEVESVLDGKTVTQAGLRNMSNAFLYALVREGEVISPVEPNTRLRRGDIASFTGQADSVEEITKHKGLAPAEQKHVYKLQHAQLAYYEVIIGNSSPLVGKTIKQAGFRGVYQAAVVAVHRSGERIDSKPGSVKLRVGDTLLIVADQHFQERWSHRKDFLAIFPLGIQHSRRSNHSLLVVGILLAALATIVLGWLPLSAAVLLAATLLIISGLISFTDAKNAIDFEVLIMIGAAFGLANAVSASGVAEAIATSLTDSLGVFGTFGVITGIVIATVVLTEMITNNAAALLMMPIAINAALAVEADPRMFALAVAVAASASFLTPVGYQTNTMVYGPGGYKFSDYARLGFPLTIIVVAVLVGWLPVIW